MSSNKICDWRPGGAMLYCRRDDGPWILSGVETLPESCASKEDAGKRGAPFLSGCFVQNMSHIIWVILYYIIPVILYDRYKNGVCVTIYIAEFFVFFLFFLNISLFCIFSLFFFVFCIFFLPIFFRGSTASTFCIHAERNWLADDSNWFNLADPSIRLWPWRWRPYQITKEKCLWSTRASAYSRSIWFAKRRKSARWLGRNDGRNYCDASRF